MKITMFQFEVMLQTLKGSLSFHERNNMEPFTYSKKAREKVLIDIMSQRGDVEITEP